MGLNNNGIMHRMDNDSEFEESEWDPIVRASPLQTSLSEELEDWLPTKEPQLYLCDIWIQSFMGVRKPKNITTNENECRKKLFHINYDVNGVRIWFHH